MFRLSKFYPTFIIVLDILFLAMFFFIPLYAFSFLSAQISQIPQTTFSLASTEELQSFQDMAARILFSLIMFIVLILFSFLANLSLPKYLIWSLTLKKQITFKLFLKSLWIIFLSFLIFLIPFIAAFMPLVGKISFVWYNFLPLAIITYLYIHFNTFLIFNLTKTGKIKQAFKQSFNITNIKYSYLYTLVPFAIIILSYMILRFTPVLAIVLPIAIAVSFVSRMHIAKKF